MSSEKSSFSLGTLIGLLFILIVLFYLPTYAPQIIDYLNQFPLFSFLTEQTIAHPYLSLLVFSAIMTLISTLLMKYLTDQEHLKSLKKRQKELQKDLRDAQKNKEFKKLEEINKELIDAGLAVAKASFSIKMMIITMVPFFLVFLWLKQIYLESIGWGFWHFFIIYLVFAVILSTLYRKLFKMA